MKKKMNIITEPVKKLFEEPIQLEKVEVSLKEMKKENICKSTNSWNLYCR